MNKLTWLLADKDMEKFISTIGNLCKFYFIYFFFLQLLCLVGEAFDDYSDDVCGAVINVRAKGDKIAIWTTDYENKDAIIHIG